MFIKAICMSGFKNHEEAQVFKFSHYSEILGKNAQGKTTIGEGIAWGLYGCDLTGDTKCDTRLMNDAPNTDCMYVIVDFEYQDMDYRLIRKKTKAKSLTLKLNDERITEKELLKHLPNKDLFLAIFNPKVFLSYSVTKQRELLLKMLPKIDHNDVIQKFKCEGMDELLEKYPNINDGLKKLSSLISNKDDLLETKNSNINLLQSMILENSKTIEIKDEFTKNDEQLLRELESKLVNKDTNSVQLILTNEIEAKINKIDNQIAIEQSKEYKSSTADYIHELELSLAKLSGEFETVTNSYNRFNSMDSVCSMCGQPITEEHRNKELALLNEKLTDITNQCTGLEESINLLKRIDEDNLNSFNNNKSNVLEKLEFTKNALCNELNAIEESNRYLTELSLKNNNVNDIEVQINNLKQKQLDYINYKYKISTQNQNIEDYKKKIAGIKKDITNITNDKNMLNIQYHKLKDYSSLYVQYIGGILSSWLNRVSINLFTVNSTGEIKETFEIKYDNKPLRLISNSEFIKVGLEFSNMFNNALNINLPVFVDDSECILDIPKLSTQMIVSKVVDCELTITSTDDYKKEEVEIIEEYNSNDSIVINQTEDTEIINNFGEVQQLAFV